VTLEIVWDSDPVSMMVSLRPCPNLSVVAISGPEGQGFARQAGFLHQGGSFG